ncbi:hypothetical protein NT6N_01230 [Oceaniferula spumae]|uniref:Fibronectin type-III domain-containing protein n=1 Tax=Oceaniferula spumae TaxID=2979115 RepID=A0AAT9FGH3_9BACT
MKNFHLPLFFISSLIAPVFAVDAPTNGEALPAGPSTIALHWTDNSADETGFEIYRDGGGTPVATVPSGQTFYYDRGLTAGSTHSYSVVAIKNAESSTPHNIPSATTMSFQMNIIFFLADDMGYKDIVALRNPGIDGPTIHETPNLDTFIQATAMRVDNAYCSGPRCVVARRSIQTGKYDWRPEAIPGNEWYLDHNNDKIGGGIFAGGTSVNPDTAGQQIPDNETYGEALKSSGYRTCFIGKYHLGESQGAHEPTGYNFGDQPGRGPIHQGYDVSIGSGHAGAPPTSYFALENPNQAGEFTFELPDLDDTGYMLNPAAPVADDYITDRLTNKAIGFINDAITNHTSQPFHLTLAHYAVHTPAECKNNAQDNDGKGHEYFQSKKTTMASQFTDFLATVPDYNPKGGDAASGLDTDQSSYMRLTQDNPVYAGMMKSYDDSFGALWSYLQATDDPRNPGKKLSETTAIIISSDHGGKSTTAINKNDDLEPADGSAPVIDGTNDIGIPNPYNAYPTTNYPYRAGKTWVYEGGLKVPLIVYIPGVTTGGSHTSAFVHHADLFATFVDLAGGAQSAESTDSVSFMLSAADPNATARNELHHFFTNASTGTGNPAIAAYRKGDYKLLYFMVQRRLELYNLAADPYELNDLSTARPDLANEMFHEVYQQAVSTGMIMPKPGSGSWKNEQEVLVDNGVIGSLPNPPNAAPSNLQLAQTPEGYVELTWDPNATDATHAVIHRNSPREPDTNYREIAYVPIGQTSYIDKTVDFQSGENNNFRYRVEVENLGGWNGMTIDGSGLFSDGNSNNTGNVTIPVTSPTGTSSDAVDDDITTVLGELRSINPLLNDSGVGALTIVAITQPGEGSATFDSKRVYFDTPHSFSGSTTMTYTIADSNGNQDTATLAIGLPVQDSNKNVIEHWAFNEGAGMQLEQTSSENGLQFGGSTSGSVATNGSGQLVLVDDGTNYNRNAGPIQGGAINSGKLEIEYHVTSADMTNSSNGSAFGFSLRDGNTNTDFGLVRFKKTGGGIVLEVNTSVASPDEVHAFGADTIANVTVFSVLDLDASPVTITTSISINGGALVSETTTNADPGASVVTDLKFNANIQDLNAGASVSIDYVRVQELSAATTLYQTWAATYPWNGELKTGPNDDADFDGINNLLEFAFGLAPTVPNLQSDLGVTLSANGTMLSFTPIRDTSLLNYDVEFSDDLSVWDSFTPFHVGSGEAENTQNATLPMGDKIFSRVKVSNP